MNKPRVPNIYIYFLNIWEIWCKRNARVFRKPETSVPGLLSKIKNEAAVWVMAGARI